MGVPSVFWLVVFSSAGQVLTVDMSHHSHQSITEPDVKNPVDYKGIVIVAVIFAIIIVMMFVLLLICYGKRCRKREREEQENNGGSGTETPLMTIIGRDVDTGSSSTEAYAV